MPNSVGVLSDVPAVVGAVCTSIIACGYFPSLPDLQLIHTSRTKIVKQRTGRVTETSAGDCLQVWTEGFYVHILAPGLRSIRNCS